MNTRTLLLLAVLVAAAGGWYYTQGSSQIPDNSLPIVAPPPVVHADPLPEPPAEALPEAPTDAGAVAETPNAPTDAAQAPAEAVATASATAPAPIAEAQSLVTTANASHAAAEAALNADQTTPPPAALAVEAPEVVSSEIPVIGPEPMAATEEPVVAPKEEKPKTEKKSKGRWASLSPEEREGKHDLNTPVDEKEWADVTRSIASVPVTAQEGDTMVDVAKRVYGDSHLWPKLWSLNPQIGNPYVVKEGTQLKVK